MANEEMPSWVHQIEVFGPSKNIDEVQKAANSRLEELAKAIINTVDVRECHSGWIIVIKWKMRTSDQQ